MSNDAAGPKLRSVRLRSGITYPDLFRFGWAGRVADNASLQRDAEASSGNRTSDRALGLEIPARRRAHPHFTTGGASPSRFPAYPAGSN